jgi:excisionase family DNA binding protein
MATISSKDAAERLKISVRRVQELIKKERLPAKMIGGVYLIEEKDLALVKNRRPGRPRTRTVSKRRAKVTKPEVSASRK